MPALHASLGEYEVAEAIFAEATDLLHAHPDWLQSGLSRRAVGEMLNLATTERYPKPIRERWWAQAKQLISRGVPGTFDFYRNVARVATLFGDPIAAHFTELEQKERARLRFPG